MTELVAFADSESPGGAVFERRYENRAPNATIASSAAPKKNTGAKRWKLVLTILLCERRRCGTSTPLVFRTIGWPSSRISKRQPHFIHLMRFPVWMGSAWYTSPSRGQT